MYTRAKVLLLALTFLLVVSNAGNSLAATVSSGSGIKLSPVRYDLTLDPGQSKTIQFNVQNVTKGTATYEAVVTDFSASGQNGAPQLIVTGSKFNPHSIKQFLSPIQNFTVAANQTKSVNIKISIPKVTAGGGYYGAIRFLSVNSQTNKTVNVASSVAGLILITVPGPAMKESVTLSSFAAGINGQLGKLFYSNGNISVYATFKDTGNVQEQPFGQVVVNNISGDKIETKLINNTTPAGNVLPGSSRTFSVPLTGLGMLGKYTVSGYFGYGTKGQLLSAKTTFYVIAPWIIILAIVLIALIIVAIFFMPKIFRLWYKRSIRKAQR